MDVTGIFAEKAQEIENASIVEGHVNAGGNLVLTNAGGTEFNAGSVVRTPNIQAFTTTAGGTWEKPDGAILCYAYAIGGGGGGSGGKETTGAGASGAGGSGGGFNEGWFVAEGMPDTIAVTVGAGGPGGGAGQPGANGQLTELEGFIRAPGGVGANTEDGGASNGSGGADPPNFYSGEGSEGAVAFGTPNQPQSALRGPGGGGGGTFASTPTAIAGGYPGVTGWGAGNVIVASLATLMPGPGGWGGATQVAAPYALDGAPGGLYGGGGGGGGASSGPAAYGAGGDGADGLLVVITFF